ncbi:hypothetical protein BDZ89DRAFT_1063946 [Hymenopellis radicata]|nr:hypothetical protein BDZ89DRAFT_1063946 [Hymenopellis radicata]
MARVDCHRRPSCAGCFVWGPVRLYLYYILLSLPQSHLARRALNAMMILGFVIPVLDVLNASEQSVEDHCSAVVTAMETDLQQSTDSTDKLYLIQGRKEPRQDLRSLWCRV